MGSFREQLALALQHKAFLFELGRKHPPYNDLSVEATYALFKEEFLAQCPILDKLGRSVKVEVTNFRKLLNLKLKNGEKKDAWKVVDELETGKFDLSQYQMEEDRIRTLFWIPEVLSEPDAVYKNGHCTVKADEVFICVFDKALSKVNLVFTATFGKKPFTRIEIVTSYLTDAKGALGCITGEPLYHK
jgi:hypothetical protein